MTARSQLFFSVKVHKIELSFQNDEYQQSNVMVKLTEGRHLSSQGRGAAHPVPQQNPPLDS